MLRHSFPLLLALSCHSLLHAQDASVQGVPTHKLPMIVDESGGFQLCKATVDGTVVHLLVDSGAQVEIAMTKDWATAQGKEFKEAGRADGIAGKAALFTTKFDSVEVGRAVSLSDFTANVMDVRLGIPFAKQEDGTTPKVDGLLGSVFLRNAQAVINYEKQLLEIPAKGTPPKAFLAQSLASGKRIIPLVKSSGGAAYVPIRFGEKEFLFIIDNAAGSNVMLPDVAAEIGLPIHEIEGDVKGAGSDEVKPKRGIADNVVVGDVVKLPQMDFMVMPSPGGDNLPAGTRFGGILGNSFLKQLKVCLDFQTYQMILPPLANPAEGNPAGGGIQAIPLKGDGDPAEIIEGIVKQHYQQVSLTRSVAGSYYVEAMINGKARWMCVDSGANATILDKWVAKEDQITLNDGKPASGPDGKPMPTQTGTLKSFAVGPTAFNAPTMVFTDLGNFKSLKLADGTTHPLAGLLGASYFKSMPVAIDFPKSRILLATKNIEGNIAGFRKQLGALSAPMIEAEDGLHYLVVEIMGQKGLLLVDVGALSLLLHEETATMLNLKVEDAPGPVTTLGKKDAPGKKTTLESIKIGDHKLKGRLEVKLLPGTKNEEAKGMPVLGIVGCNFFELFKSTVDFKADAVTLSKELFEVN